MTPARMADIHEAAFTVPAPWDARTFEKWLATPGVAVTTAPDGFCLTRVVADEAEILTLAVHPSCQRTGQGQQVLRGALSRARSEGAAFAILEVAATNAPARALYDRVGFAQVGLRPQYYRGKDGLRIDALILRAELDDIAPS